MNIYCTAIRLYFCEKKEKSTGGTAEALWIFLRLWRSRSMDLWEMGPLTSSISGERPQSNSASHSELQGMWPSDTIRLNAILQYWKKNITAYVLDIFIVYILQIQLRTYGYSYTARSLKHFYKGELMLLNLNAKIAMYVAGFRGRDSVTGITVLWGCIQRPRAVQGQTPQWERHPKVDSDSSETMAAA